MVVCRFFVEGKCRFGENCKFEHPRGDVQRNLFGQPRDNSWGTPTQNNKYKWTAGSQQPVTGGTTSALDLVNNLPREMEVWEASRMWPFSCLSLERDLECLPGFNYDVSCEELRTEAYAALKAGSIQPYVQKIQSLNAEFQNKRQHLKNMSPDMKQKLVTLLEELRKKRHIASSQQPTSSLLQTSQPQSSSGSLFGKPAGGGVNPLNPFGGSQENKPAAGAGLFGKPAFPSTLGASSNPTAGGGGGSSLFGNKTNLTNSPFGNPATPGGAGLFGSQQPAGGAAPTVNPFAAAGNPAGGGQSLFGGHHGTGSVFGGGTQPAPQGLFGQPAAASTPPSGSGLFGNSGVGAGKNPSIMGAGPTAASPLNQNPGLLGTGTSTNQPATLFGKPVAGVTGVSSTDSSSSTGLFGKPAMGQGMFGSVNSGQSQNLSSSGAVASEANASGVYTLLEELTDFEKAEFKAEAFTLGRIPLRPPARELVNV